MKIDLKRLAAALKDYTEKERSDDILGVKYLVENIYKPFTGDEPIYFKNLDFDAFDREDIFRFCEWLYQTHKEFNELNKRLCCAPPAAISSRVFF